MNKNYFYFILCSLIWGTTWLVIKYQINGPGVFAAVFWRFLIATILMFILTFFIKKHNATYSIKYHFVFMLHGLFNFCLNYLLTYEAEKNLNSGLVALTFTLLIYFNMIGLKIFFNKPLSRNVLLGSFLGGAGIYLIFSKEIGLQVFDAQLRNGILVSIIATLFASFGNMFAYKNHQRGIPVLVFNSYGMFYGTIFTLIFSQFLHASLTIPVTLQFLTPLFYLAVLGTVIAFWAYQNLVGSIGADRAAYTSIISPLLAVVTASIFENLALTAIMAAGILLCLTGNFISLKKE